MKRILIVEDEKIIRDELINLLSSSNYDCDYIKDFNNSYNEIIDYKPDLILMDINIPNINGVMLLKEIRKSINVPVFMVTSKDTITDEVLSYSYGADDYIIKPYNPTILVLKIQALFKRIDSKSSIINYKDFSFDIGKGIIKRDNDSIVLTKNEIIIFNLLINNRDRIVTKDEIMTDLWNNDEYINENALTVNISRLRSKLNSIGYSNIIETRKGIGYRLL